MPSSPRPGARPLAGNAAAGIAGLLSSLGVADTHTRDSVEEAVAAELERRGLDAAVHELRWGTLTLTAAPQAAQLLRFDEDTLLEALDRAHPGQVTRLRVQVRRA